MNDDFGDPYEGSGGAHPDGEAAAFREFALACRAERDRLALAALERDDRDFEGRDARGRADLEAARLIAAAARR